MVVLIIYFSKHLHGSTSKESKRIRVIALLCTRNENPFRFLKKSTGFEMNGSVQLYATFTSFDCTLKVKFFVK